MKIIKLTEESIREDLAGFEQRILNARQKAEALPEVTAYKERKKVLRARVALLAEIAHVQRLVGYAADALRELN